MQTYRKTIYGLLLVVLCVTGGCGILGVNRSRNAANEDAAKDKVRQVETMMDTNLKDKMDQVANFSYGIDYVLTKEPDPSRYVMVAKDLNLRTLSLTGSPTIEEINEMKQMVEYLTSQLNTEREKGKKTLADKDNIIQSLQERSQELAVARDAEIKKYMDLAAETALKADKAQIELDKMNSYMGLGAVWYGISRFVVRSAWILGGIGIVFLILRIGSFANPICAAIFGIFEQIVAWGLNIIKVIFPKAMQFAGHVTKSSYDALHILFTKIVDSIQWIKEMEKQTGKSITLKELLEQLDKTMDANEKAMISDLKKKLGY